MLAVNKINTNITFKSNNKLNNNKKYSFGNEADAWKAYYDMNKDVYADYADGDISFWSFIGGKMKNLWAILTAQDPKLEIKEQMIEENLLKQAQREIDLAA